ncbi:MAG: tetratricopeptide repeat protein, partial [Caldilineaceae bacterium]|nr:tetratricopeptide repeat protein [Caldilineaceae bacterium]
MSYNPDFAELLNQYLTARDRSGSWLAQRLSVNPATVSRWRNGDNRPNQPEVIIQIADILSVPREERPAFLHAAGYGYIEGGNTVSPEAIGENTVGENDTPADHQNYPSQIDADSSNTDEESVDIFSRDTDESDELDELDATADRMPQQRVQIDRWLNQLHQHRYLALGSLGAVVITLAIWLAFGQPGFRSEATATVTMQRFAVDEWQNLSPGASPNELIWINDTERIIYQKLSQVPALTGFTQRGPQLTESQRQTLDLWIEGSYRKLNDVELSADLYGRNGEFLRSVSVSAAVDDNVNTASVCILDLQNQLAEAILAALDIAVEAKVHDAIHDVPTHSCEALHLNNDAANFVMQNNFATAQTLLEQALAIDPDYADAINNLGQLLYRQQRWQEAVAQYQRAINIQPGIAVFHYNLALAEERLDNYEKAVAAYETAIQLEPLYPQALNNLGFTYLQMKQP